MDYEKLSCGYYRVGQRKFSSKFEALVSATENKQKIEYIFFDHIWHNFDKRTLGKRNLKNLYFRRAQQLREEYDYLILYFSGGADSYNVLRSFIDNNIRLDEVCVKWPMITIDNQFYSPDPNNTSARNYLSEWDYAIKPVLDKLKNSHPEIKIEIADWSYNLNSKTYSEELLKSFGTWNDVEMPMAMTFSSSENNILDKGKKVASIYGVDKPLLGYDKSKWYMGFSDMATGMGLPQYSNENNVEYFYWTPDMPELAFEQAYLVCQYLDKHPDLLRFFHSRNMPNDKQTFIESRQVQNDLIKSLIYDNWTNVFQSSKPIAFDRADKQFWIFENPEFSLFRDSFLDLNSLALNQIDTKYFSVETEGIQYKDKIRGIFKTTWSKWHYVKDRELL